jgi:hypothetical protein
MNIKKLIKRLGIDERRCVTVRQPFSWSVTSYDGKELGGWAGSFGLTDLLVTEMTKSAPKEGTYITTAMAMRPLTHDNYVIVVFGYASENLQAGYRGALGICKTGQEEAFGASLAREVIKEFREYIHLRDLKNNTNEAEKLVETAGQCETSWVPAKGGEDLSDPGEVPPKGMQIVIDGSIAFNVGKTVMRNGLCMLLCDTPGGRLFTYLRWDTKQRAVEIEGYSQHPAVVSVKSGREVKAMILSRRQLVMIGGDIKDEIEESVNCEATREAAMEWIDSQGGFRRNHETGNWENPADAFFPPFRVPLPPEAE